MAALVTDKERGKEIHAPAGGRLHVHIQELLHRGKQLRGDDSRAVIRVRAPVAVIDADVQRAPQNPLDGLEAPVKAVCFLNVPERGPLGDVGREGFKKILFCIVLLLVGGKSRITMIEIAIAEQSGIFKSQF